MKSMSITLTLSDPWDLGESLDWKPQTGEILRSSVDDRGGRVLIRLDKPIVHREVDYQFVVALPRHDGDRLDTGSLKEKICCSFTGITDEHAESENPLSLDHWRGGLAFIGDLFASSEE